jgi:hypothetical protein
MVDFGKPPQKYTPRLNSERYGVEWDFLFHVKTFSMKLESDQSDEKELPLLSEMSKKFGKKCSHNFIPTRFVEFMLT